MKTVLIRPTIILLISAFALSSCTVEKRRYSSGYHIDWHINKDHSKKRTKTKTPTPKENSTVMAQGDSINATSIDSITVSSNQNLASSNTVNTKPKKKIVEKIISNQVAKSVIKIADKQLQHIGIKLPKTESINDPIERPEEKKLLVRGLIAFIFGLLALIMIAVLYTGAVSGGFLVVIIPFAVWLGSIITSMTMGIWGIVESAMEPEKYTGSFLAYIGVICAILAILLFITLIIL